jgi:hypothetical protein
MQIAYLGGYYFEFPHSMALLELLSPCGGEPELLAPWEMTDVKLVFTGSVLSK